MTLVIDACVAAKWFFEEDDTDRADALLLSAKALIALEIAPVEIMNAAWKRAARQLITTREAEITCERAMSIYTKTEPLAKLWNRAGEIMIFLSHPIYDCLYLTLAERERAPLITVDRRLIEAGQKLRTVEVVHLRDF